MQYLPSREAAKILGLHPHTLRRYADAGIIPSIKTQSGQRRYDVETYLGNSKTQHHHLLLPGLQPTSRPATSNDRSPSCRNTSQTQRSSLTSPQDSTTGAKDLATILERIHQGDKLTLVVAYRDRTGPVRDRTYRANPPAKRWRHSWFSTSEISAPQRNSPRIYSPSLLSSLPRASGLRRYRKKIQEDKNLPRPAPEGQA